MLRLSRKILEAVHREYDGTGKEGNHAWKSTKLANEVYHVANEQNEAGLLDRLMAEGVNLFEEQTKSKPEDNSQEQAEAEQVDEADEDVHYEASP